MNKVIFIISPIILKHFGDIISIIIFQLMIIVKLFNQ